MQLKKINEHKIFYILLIILFFSPLWLVWIWHELPNKYIPDGLEPEGTYFNHITLAFWLIPIGVFFASLGKTTSTRTKTGRGFESESGERFNEYETDTYSEPDNFKIGYEFGLTLMFQLIVAVILTAIVFGFI